MALEALRKDRATLAGCNGVEGGEVDVVRQQRREDEQPRVAPASREVAGAQRTVGSAHKPQPALTVHAAEFEGEGAGDGNDFHVVAGESVEVCIGAAGGEDRGSLSEGGDGASGVGDRSAGARGGCFAVSEQVEAQVADDENGRRGW